MSYNAVELGRNVDRFKAFVSSPRADAGGSSKTMALFRKFFYRKPPDGLLEISERVYVFDCCFTTDVLEDDEYKVYTGGIVGQLRDHLPDASFMVFNFREGEKQSQIASILSDYDMTVMDYPRHYEGCPLLTMEMIHHFLRSSESWLSLGQQNVLLMHCERGGWPVLAFMLAALLIYRKQYTGEQKTLDMIYKQAPRELLHVMSPLNPLPSQLRYLQYISRRNVGSEWPPLDRALTLDCIIIRLIPSLDGEGGCRPIFRIYGQDPFMAADRTPKVLFSTPKRSKLVRHYKQADCELVKIDIHCHIQGDVVLECVSLESDLEREEMMFRVMFNTAFIRSNILMLNRDEIDILWNGKDQFPKDFRVEILFSEMDAASSLISVDLPGIEEKEGLPVEAFAKVQEIFSNVDWIDSKTEVANVLQQITVSNILLEKLESGGSTHMVETSCLLQEPAPAKLSLESVAVSENDNNSPTFRDPEKKPIPLLKPSMESHSIKTKIEPQDLQVGLQQPSRSKIISQRVPRVPQTPPSAPVSYCNSLQGSPVPISRYHSAPSALGITALLQDHAAMDNKDEVNDPKPISPPTTSTSSQSLSMVSKSTKPISMHVPLPTSPPTTSEKTSGPPSQVPQSPSKSLQSFLKLDPETTLHGRGQKSSISPPAPPPPPLTVTIKDSLSIPPPPPPPPHLPVTKCNKDSLSIPPHPPPPPPLPATMKDSLSIPRPPPPPPHLQGALPFPATKSSFSSPPPPPPPPPHPLPPPSPGVSPSSTVKGSIKSPPLPPPPPPPPPFSGKPSSSTVQTSFPTPPPPPPRHGASSSSSSTMKSSVAFPGPPPPPPPPPGQSGLPSGPAVVSSVPLPPPPPNSASKDSFSNNSANVPPPPPPAPFANGLSKAGGASTQAHSGVSNGNVPPVPGLPSGASFSLKGRGLSRTTPKNQTQPKRSNLKPYHWLKLTRAMQGSLWAEAQKTDEASKAPEFDMSELESLFSAAAPNPDHGKTGGKSNRRTSVPKTEKVQLIELRRAYNCEIMLTKVKIPLPDLMSSVLALDDSALDADQVENLIKFCPTKEEMELLKGYNGDKNNLGKCEQFFLELMKVPRVESKLRVFSFKIQFCSQVVELRRDLNIVNSTSEETRNSIKLKRIMQTILSLGNALNHGTARGSAIGFRLDSLLKLTDTRARNNKMTLMHYLCKVLAEKLPELLDFPKDLVSLEAATKIQLKYLAEEMQAISKGLEKVVQELSASENDGPVSDQFCKILKEFLCDAEAEVRSLASLYSNVGRNADALALYFGEDPARCPFEQVVSTLLNFVRMFVRAHKENCKQIELEKKKAAKEAENEKLKLGTKKESETMIRTSIKSGNIL